MPTRSPAVLPQPPAELALSLLSDMADTKNSPEYAAFFAVIGASAAMVFSGEHRSRRSGGVPKRCGTRARRSLGAGRDVTLTSFPAMWVSGLAGGCQPRGGGDSELWSTELMGLIQVLVISASRASFVRGWGGGVAAILAPRSRHEGGVGVRGAARDPVPAPALAPHPAFLRTGVTSHLERRQSVGCGGPST